ncbi:MAG: DUF1275 domain-containing protein [Clostridia bacterium]|nr:DUF1275 domain-containing protein [Clostridia bacterium]
MNKETEESQEKDTAPETAEDANGTVTDTNGTEAGNAGAGGETSGPVLVQRHWKHIRTHGCEPHHEGKDLVALATKYQEHKPLMCERLIIYVLLMITAGIMGAYTYNCRGGVFCNAQTANVVMMAIQLGNGNWADGFYYLIPICAYILGGFVSEMLPNPVKKAHLFRWDTYFILFEILVLFGIGWIPTDSGSVWVTRGVQIIINFTASMQYNTFRKSSGVPMATTFCTNHCRMIGVALADCIRHKDMNRLREVGIHVLMIVGFLAAGIVETLFSFMDGKAIWVALVPLLIAFVILAYADLGPEKARLLEVPIGH